MNATTLRAYLESLGFQQHTSGKWWQLVFPKHGTIRITINETVSIYKLTVINTVTYRLMDFPLQAVPLNLIRLLAKPSSHHD